MASFVPALPAHPPAQLSLRRASVTSSGQLMSSHAKQLKRESRRLYCKIGDGAAVQQHAKSDFFHMSGMGRLVTRKSDLVHMSGMGRFGRCNCRDKPGHGAIEAVSRQRTARKDTPLSAPQFRKFKDCSHLLGTHSAWQILQTQT